AFCRHTTHTPNAMATSSGGTISISTVSRVITRALVVGVSAPSSGSGAPGPAPSSGVGGGSSRVRVSVSAMVGSPAVPGVVRTGGSSGVPGGTVTGVDPFSRLLLQQPHVADDRVEVHQAQVLVAVPGDHRTGMGSGQHGVQRVVEGGGLVERDHVLAWSVSHRRAG